MNINKEIDSHNRSWYRKVYRSIIARARSRGLDRIQLKEKFGYMEIHHIFPKCLGGQDENFNMIALTYKEHFICHKILCRLFPNNYWIHSSFYLMCHIEITEDGKKIKKELSAREAEEWKLFSKSHKKPLSEETLKKMSESRIGVSRGPMSEKTKEVLRKKAIERGSGKDEKTIQRLKGYAESLKGTKRSKEACDKSSISLKKYYKTVDPDKEAQRRVNISKAKKGTPANMEAIMKGVETRRKNGNYITSEETRKRMSLARKGKNNISPKAKEDMSIRYGFGLEYTSNSGTIYKFNSISEAVRKLKELGILNRSFKYIKSRAEKGMEGFRFVNTINKMVEKPVIGPDSTVYSSLSECAKELGINRSTLLNWINKFPEKGYKYKE